MGRGLTHTETAQLLGAYALDAVDPAERAGIEEHLKDCRICQTEAAQHREVAGFLAPGDTQAPTELWDRIAGSIEERPPPLDLAAVRAQRERNRQRRGGLAAGIAAIAAVAIAAAGFAGYEVADGSGGSRVQQTAALDVAAKAALANPAARKVAMRSPGSDLSADAVVLPDGTGYLVSNNLPGLDSGRTYQLWAVVGANKVSVGVLGGQPGRLAFRAAGDVSALAITREKAGGVETPTQDPVVAGTLGAA
jgi:anti-sigma factor RsiW